MHAGKGLTVSIVAVALTVAAASAQTSPPEGPPSPPGTVAPSELRSKPQFRSGQDPDKLPEIAALAAQKRYGEVVAQATVTPDGTLTDIVMAEPSGIAAVDQAIIRALTTWKLSSPIDKTGAKVATVARFPLILGAFPERLSGSPVAMPEAAKAAFHNGKVSARYRIDTDGRTSGAVIVRSSGSPLLDNALLTGIATLRYAPPKDLSGNPTALDAGVTQNFSQAEGGTGSYIGGLKTYRCATFTGELDWWTQAHPGKKVSELEFYLFMSGLAYIAPDALGWKRPELSQLSKRHTAAWDSAVTACRKVPASTFLEHYRRG